MFSMACSRLAASADKTRCAQSMNLPRGNAGGNGMPGQRPNVLRGWIRQRLFMGGHHEYMVETAAGLARVFSSRVFAEGGRVVLSFEAEDCIFLPGE